MIGDGFMKIKILFVLLFFPWVPFSAYSKETSQEQTLTPEIIFHRFPVCSFSSSLGQWCKALSEDKRETFSFSKLPGSVVLDTIFRKVEIIKFLENKLIIEEDDWFHTFVIKKIGNSNFEVQRIDDGKTGTYFSEVIYQILFDEEAKNWKIISEKSDSNFSEINDTFFLNRK